MSRPVTIVGQPEYEVFNPLITDDWKDTLKGKVTTCTLILDDGVNHDIEFVGSFEQDGVGDDTYTPEFAQQQAYQNAISQAQGEGYVLSGFDY